MKEERYDIIAFNLSNFKKALAFSWMLLFPTSAVGAILMSMHFSFTDSLRPDFYFYIFIFVFIILSIFIWKKFKWLTTGCYGIENNNIVFDSKSMTGDLNYAPLNASLIWKEKLNYFFFPPLKKGLYFLFIKYPERNIYTIKTIGIGTAEEIDERLARIFKAMDH